MARVLALVALALLPLRSAVLTDEPERPPPARALAPPAPPVLFSTRATGPFAVSPDSKVVATGEDGAVRFWDLASGRLLRTIAREREFHVRSLAFAPDGKKVAVVAGAWKGVALSGPTPVDDSIHIIEVATGKALHRLRSERHGWAGAEFLAAGRTLLSRGYAWFDEPVLWDVTTGRRLPPLTGMSHSATARDGTLLATVSSKGTLHLWAPASGKQLRQLEGHPRATGPLALSPDGRYLAVAEAFPHHANSGQACPIHLWDLDTGASLARLKGPQALRVGLGRPLTVGSLAFAPDGKSLLVTGAANGMFLFDVPRGTLQGHFSGGRRGDLIGAPWAVFSPDGKSLAVTPGDHTVQLWGLPDLTERWRQKTTARWEIALSFIPDGRHLLATAPNLRVWETATGRELLARDPALPAR